MFKKLSAFWLLSLFDALMTIYAVVVAEYAYEANPIMAIVLGYGAIAFFLVKMGLTSLAALVLWYISKKWPGVANQKTMNIALWVVLGVYGLLAVWHIVCFATATIHP